MILPKSSLYSTEKTSEHKNLIYLFSYVKYVIESAGCMGYIRLINPLLQLYNSLKTLGFTLAIQQ